MQPAKGRDVQIVRQKFIAAFCQLAFFLIATILSASMIWAAPKKTVKAADPAPNPKYAAIIIDAHSGKTLYQENANARRYPASLTKMMTLYLLFEAMQAGCIAPETPIPVSAYAAARPPTKIGFKPGQTIAAEAAAKALITRSANDVASAIAEYLGGSESRFAKNMTTKARQLGMLNTNFANASGLPDNNNYSTARDMAILSLALREHFPQYYPLFNISSFVFRGQTINSHNRLVRSMKGVDGIKTGFIRASGFNVATSMRADGKSLVGVVMGGRTGASRDEHMRSLLKRYIGQASKTPKNTLLVAKAAPQPQSEPKGQSSNLVAYHLPDEHNVPIPVAKFVARAKDEQPKIAEDSAIMSAQVTVDDIEKLLEEQEQATELAVLAYAALPTKPLPAKPLPADLQEIDLLSEHADLGEVNNARQSKQESIVKKNISDKQLKDHQHDSLLLAALAEQYPGSTPSFMNIDEIIAQQDMMIIAATQNVTEDPDKNPEKTLAYQEKQSVQEQEIDIFTTASISNSKKGWVIQIATTNTVREADMALYKALNTAAKRLDRAEPYLQLHDEGQTRYYRARFAGFKSQKSALNACVELHTNNIDCYVLED